MTIAFSDADGRIHADHTGTGHRESVLIDKYISGREIEVDAIYDGTDVLIRRYGAY